MNDVFASFTKEQRMADLYESVQHCTLCERLRDRVKVLSEKNGNINSKVLFIAEAPGRLGADRTRIPLYGDRTGDNFEILLRSIGWRREDIFITNAVLCNPREEKGTNGTPTKKELKNCSCYLMMTIELVKPKIIVTLGKTALDALNIISSHTTQLKSGVGKRFLWNEYTVIPFYHPGPRAMIHRDFQKQKADFEKLLRYVMTWEQ
ncbi:uracil-DNA glycosylase [Heliobacterium undosum]|uniref:Uracil-DNA glycosylase n=1 Tax=Heliomicrobium undosum TaxID=121734 RepID=A0A845L7N2_9FIRM|nr:uracil-DNA glycosylase [Heliomicrobium undosum]MZP31299.1 uracil-DNA glycosylase [Heliomicrobium undosum]